jgi:ADP-ribose pyrophosphatase
MNRVKHWQELASRHVLDCGVFSVDELQSRSPADGSEHRFFRINANDWVQLVPVTKQREIVMVRQYRHGSGELSLEVPAGIIDPGESPEEAAVRECLEETGYRARALKPLGVFRPNPAYFANRLSAFFSSDLESVGAIQNTGTEQTELVLVPVDDVPSLLVDGTIDHALAVAVLWRFLHEFE